MQYEMISNQIQDLIGDRGRWLEVVVNDWSDDWWFESIGHCSCYYYCRSVVKDGYANGGPVVETNPELMRRPLRERIIHLLAIRSYKKPELVTRLHRGWLVGWCAGRCASSIVHHTSSYMLNVVCVQRVWRRRIRSWSCPSWRPSVWWRTRPITWPGTSGTTCTTTGHSTLTRRNKSSKGMFPITSRLGRKHLHFITSD